MDLDEFKTTWQAYDQKLDSTNQLGHQLLRIILQNQSKSTIDKMFRELRLPAIILLALVLFFSAVVAGNPFDYRQFVEFVPAVCYLGIAAVGLYFLIRHNADLRQTTLPSRDLHQSLTDLIQLRTRHMNLMKRVWMLAMLAGPMVLLPIVTRKFADAGWVYTLLLVLLPIAITAISIGLASVVGLFKDHYLTELRAQLNELEEIA